MPDPHPLGCHGDQTPPRRPMAPFSCAHNVQSDRSFANIERRRASSGCASRKSRWDNGPSIGHHGWIFVAYLKRLPTTKTTKSPSIRAVVEVEESLIRESLGWSSPHPSPIGRVCATSQHRTRCGAALTLAYLPATLSRSRMLREEERSIPRRGDAPILYKMRKERPPTFNRLVPATSCTNIRNTRFPTRVAEGQLSVLLTQLKSELASSFAGVGSHAGRRAQTAWCRYARSSDFRNGVQASSVRTYHQPFDDRSVDPTHSHHWTYDSLTPFSQ